MARDALQGVMERLVRRRLPSDANVDAYVRTSLVNAHRDRWRRRRPDEPLDDHALPYRDSVDHVDGDTSTVLAVLRDMPARQRAVMVLRYFEDLSEAETAHAMHVSAGSVKTQAHRGMAKLREALKAAREMENR